MSDRVDIVERRQVLLMRALRGEFANAPLGEFEARWAAIDPLTPAPKHRAVYFLSCECKSCVRSYDADMERPITPNPLDGTRLWDNS